MISLQEKDRKDRREGSAILARMLAGITLFEQEHGCRPAALLMDYDMFWRTLSSEYILLKSGCIVELDGVRVIPSPDLEGKIYLAEKLYEVPDVIFLEDS